MWFCFNTLIKNHLHTMEIFIFQSLSFTNYGQYRRHFKSFVDMWTQILLHLLFVSFIGSNLLTIKDEAENSFLLEELVVFAASVQTVWLNAQLYAGGKCLVWRRGQGRNKHTWSGWWTWPLRTRKLSDAVNKYHESESHFFQRQHC